MVTVVEGGESSLGLGVFSDLPDDKVHTGAGVLTGAVPIHIVLDDLSEVVGHEVAQGALIGQAQAVREQHRCVHHCAVDDLEGQQVTLEAVPNEDGVSAEHAQQDGLHVPQRDARVHKVGLCHP